MNDIESLFEEIRKVHLSIPSSQSGDKLRITIESSDSMVMLTQYLGDYKIRSLVRYFDIPDYFVFELKRILEDYLLLILQRK